MLNQISYMEMTPNKYIETRLDEQQKWFSKKSSRYQNFYKWLKRIELTLIACIPLVTVIPFSDIIYNQIITITISVVATILKLYNTIGTYFDLWIKYRNISEQLKSEKMFYITGTGVYANKKNAFSLLVERTEFIISKANNEWSTIIKDIPNNLKQTQSSTKS